MLDELENWRGIVNVYVCVSVVDILLILFGKLLFIVTGARRVRWHIHTFDID